MGPGPLCTVDESDLWMRLGLPTARSGDVFRHPLDRCRRLRSDEPVLKRHDARRILLNGVRAALAPDWHAQNSSSRIDSIAERDERLAQGPSDGR